ncbi:MAG TPA: glycosyltransferase N-terminal domain-containing protein [Chthoniobacteraceae bacterium]|nr:glycosyltransferase N-terminal domain-containing protein [Chthoniobacteraceae bacterium]
MRPLPEAARWPLRLYRTLFPAVFLVMLPGLLLRIWRRGGARDRFGERLGLFSPEARERLKGGGWIWIHAVSVGEMMMALKLVRAIRVVQPGARLLLSVTTSTGMAVAAKALAEEETGAGEGKTALIYYPVDFGPIVRRVLALVRPAQLVLVDKELWPNMIAACYQRRVPVSIVNARLSPRSGRRFRKWRRWVGPFFSMLEGVCLQEPEDRAVWQQLGVREEALHWTGSLKFDVLPARDDGDGGEPPEVAGLRALLCRLGGGWADPARLVLLGGSTFPGEEAMLGRVYRKLRAGFPQLRLILVPRHVERAGEVEHELAALGITCARRRRFNKPGEPEASEGEPQALLVDTTGELAHWYRLADLCVIGKSFRLTPSGEGGQNPVEAIEADCPVVCGPAMGNFAALMTALKAVEGVRIAADEAALATECEALFRDRETRNGLVERARGVLTRHHGATERVARRVLAGG